MNGTACAHDPAWGQARRRAAGVALTLAFGLGLPPTASAGTAKAFDEVVDMLRTAQLANGCRIEGLQLSAAGSSVDAGRVLSARLIGADKAADIQLSERPADAPTWGVYRMAAGGVPYWRLTVSDPDLGLTMLDWVVDDSTRRTVTLRARTGTGDELRCDAARQEVGGR